MGPVWGGGTHGEAALLASCYRRSLELAVANGLRSIAFPAISCGAYGYPLQMAVPVAIAAVRGFAHLDRLERVVFACLTAHALEVHETALGGTSS